MNIGIVIGRIGGIDGVALETEKWMEVLSDLGHVPHVLTGELEGPCAYATVLPELAFSHPATIREQNDAFFIQDADELELVARLQRDAQYIETKVLEWIEAKGVEVLITENATTLPCHLTMGMALKRVIETTGIPTFAHDHDFHWERGDRYTTRYTGIQAIIDECFPPDLPNLGHIVINSYCQESLARERSMSSVMIPNVMDFRSGFGQPDEFSRGLPQALGFDHDSILMFQITRIVRRKGIETAIDLVDRLDDRRVNLVLTGTATDDLHGEYLQELKDQAARSKRPDKIHFVADRFTNKRSSGNGGPALFSLSDAYANANAMTYFSSYEGFGNAFVEALAARVPIFVNNYKPVYWPDIGSKGFRTVQIEDNVLTAEAVEEMHEVLTDPDLRDEITDVNFELGRKFFSYDVLAAELTALLP